MGIQINGITDDISATDGGLTISDLEINQSGISTFNAGLNVGTGSSIFSPATNTLTFGTNSNERFRIKSDGKVGIGTNNPSQKLEVLGTSNLFGNGGASVQWGDTDYVGHLSFASDGAIVRAASGKALIFHTNHTNERLRIESGGDIKLSNADSIIHTSADTSRLRLFGGSSNSVNNGAALTLHGVNHSGGNYADLAAGTSGHIQFRTGTSERLRIGSNGYVNIGTGTAEEKLTIRDTTQHCLVRIISGNGSGQNAGIDFGDADDSDVGNIRYYHDSDYMRFNVNGAERLRINNNGHLGLNVTPGSWDNTFKTLEGGGNSKHGELFFQANGDWTTALGCNLYFNSGWKYRHAGAANWLEMKEDRTTFYMADSGSADSAITWLERLRIQSAGYITMPYQIAFFAYCSIGNHDLDIGDKFQFNAIPSSGKVAVNSNHTTFGGTNVFNTSTNTFTAPVNGLYSFTVTAYYRRTGDPLGPLVPRVNNSEVSNGNNNVMFFGNSDVTDGTTLSGTVILQLAANDAVTVHRRNHGTGTLRFYGPHSHFCGHLIG